MISIFTTVTDPVRRGDNWGDALKCYHDLADDIVIIDGTQKEHIRTDMNSVNIFKSVWPQEFSWEFIGQQFTRGYQACIGDWVIHCDLDFLFHQKDFGKIRQALKDYPTAPAVSFYKHQLILPHKFNLKSRLVIAVNKKAYGDRIKFDSGQDLCQPSLDGRELKLEEMPQAGVPFWNYEKLCKTEAQIKDDVGRMDRAYQRYFGRWLYSEDGTDESAYEGWWRMIEGRYSKPQQAVRIEDHPKFIQETIRNLKPNQFGYNGFGRLRGGYFEKG